MTSSTPDAIADEIEKILTLQVLEVFEEFFILEDFGEERERKGEMERQRRERERGENKTRKVERGRKVGVKE